LAKPSGGAQPVESKPDCKGKNRQISAETIDDKDDEDPGDGLDVPKSIRSSDSAVPYTESEYEREKRENINRNKELLKDVQSSYEELMKDLRGSKPANRSASGSKPKAKSAGKRSLEEQLVESLSKVGVNLLTMDGVALTGDM
jgi:hypothetical protein